MGTYLQLFIHRYCYIFIFMSHCSYNLHEVYCYMFLVEKIWNFRSTSSSLHGRKSLCFPTTVQHWKQGISFWNSGLLHSILKCRLHFYHSIFLFHLPGLPVLVFLTTSINADFFWSKWVLKILYLVERVIKSFVRCTWDSKENSEDLILALPTLSPETVDKIQPHPPFSGSFSFLDLKID